MGLRTTERHARRQGREPEAWQGMQEREYGKGPKSFYYKITTRSILKE
jgi:hypothetical protein